MIRIVSAVPLANCRLKVTFNNGLGGIFPVEPERRGGVFLKLMDARVFKAVTVRAVVKWLRVEGGVLLVPNGKK